MGIPTIDNRAYIEHFSFQKGERVYSAEKTRRERKLVIGYHPVSIKIPPSFPGYLSISPAMYNVRWRKIKAGTLRSWITAGYIAAKQNGLHFSTSLAS